MACPKKQLMLANQCPRFCLRFSQSQTRTKIVIQSAARIQMMNHIMSKPCKTLPCPSDFHDTLLAPITSLLLHLNSTPYTNFFLIINDLPLMISSSWRYISKTSLWITYKELMAVLLILDISQIWSLVNILAKRVLD